MSLYARYNKVLVHPPIGGLPLGNTLGAPPLTLPNLQFWHDPSNSSCVADNTSGALNTYKDISGAGQNFTAAGTNRPTTGTRTQNRLNVLDFDGTDDRMTSGAPDGDISCTTFIVAMADTLATSAHALVGGNGGTNGLGIRINQTTGAIETAKEGTAVIGNTIGSVSAGVPFILVVRVNATTVWHYINRRVQTTTHAQTLTARTTKLGDDNGNAAHFDGWIGEVYRSGDDVGDAAVFKQIDYLNAKWAIF